MLEAAIIESEAFMDLSGKAAVVCLIRFHQKAHRKSVKKKKGIKDLVITNNGELVFTHGEAKELGGMNSSSTFQNALHQLIENGFIDIAEDGNWYGKLPTKFSISQRWRRYGSPDFRKIKKPRINPEGVGFPKQKSLR